ncbi:MAG TPA: TIGR04255 family protein [Candidatus Nanoarchaeia archaeon]|nr:TIGR04255 family protein [Candidatus Nanoarchaeia archaeon]
MQKDLEGKLEPAKAINNRRFTKEGVRMKLPKKIKNSPINEVLLEIRFKSAYPPSAVFGVIYPKIKEQFPEKPIPHPIMQLPEHIRLNDPAFRYAPYYKISKKNLVLNIGPDIISLVNQKEYSGWKDFSSSFYKTFEKIIDSQVIEDIHLVNLRYINVFQENIFQNIKLRILFGSDAIHNQPIDLKTVFYKGDFENYIRIGNSFDIEINDQIVKRSVFDINCKRKIENTKSFLNNPSVLIEQAHIEEKETFFKTLKPDYIKKLNPVYGGES